MSLVKQPNIEISNIDIVNKYIDNPITKAIVFGGLEPFDSWDDMFEIIHMIRHLCEDDIVIYTGYNKEEIIDKVNLLKNFKKHICYKITLFIVALTLLGMIITYFAIDKSGLLELVPLLGGLVLMFFVNHTNFYLNIYLFLMLRLNRYLNVLLVEFLTSLDHKKYN